MNNIEELRRAKNYTQQQLGKIMGISQTSICRWESGNVLPETENLIKLSEILDASIDYILGKSKYYYPEDLGNGIYTTEERQLIEKYRKLPPELQKTIQNTLNTFANSVETK
ncbi:MAG: helix-turn-helix transcriptional regulator [Clostridia bacterium]|nr:helix-turn-helix transcriptional regulator [Clostridia bacterium]